MKPGEVVGERSQALARAILALIDLEFKQGATLLEILIGMLAVLNVFLTRFAKGMPEELNEFHDQVRGWMVELAEANKLMRAKAP